MVVSFGEPFELDIEGEVRHVGAAMIPRGLRHAVDTSGRRVALMLIEPHGPGGSRIAGRAIELCGRDLATSLAVGHEPADRPELLTLYADGILRSIDPGWSAASTITPPVAAALDYLDTALCGRPRLPDAARAANLSPSRLTHLFSEQVGVPFRRFVPWLRLCRAAEVMSETSNLTEAAAGAGFSDLAHFSRVCRAMFGVSPSAVAGMDVLALTGEPKSAAMFKTGTGATR